MKEQDARELMARLKEEPEDVQVVAHWKLCPYLSFLLVSFLLHQVPLKYHLKITEFELMMLIVLLLQLLALAERFRFPRSTGYPL